MVALIVSSLGLIVSIGILWIQHQNQVERRHGEIVQLKSQTLARLSDHRRRAASFLIQAEKFRMQVNQLADCEAKSKVLERMPQLMTVLNESKERADRMLKDVGDLETRNINRSARFLQLQGLLPEIQKMEEKARELEDKFIAAFASVESAVTRSGTKIG